MRARLGKTFWRNQRRRIVSAVLLIAHLLATIGFPLPATASGSCGRAASACCCGTAEQCRANHCGCPHSPALTPQVAPAIEDDVPACCAKKAAMPAETKSCCTKPAESVEQKSCCAKPTKPDVPAEEPEESPAQPEPGKVRWVIGISAQKCRGGTLAGAGDAAPLWIVAPFTLRQYWPLCACITVLQQYPFTIPAEHLDPPPRSAAS